MAMEVFNGVVMRSRPCFYSGGAGIDHRHSVCVGGLSRIPCESRLRSRSMRRRVVGELSAFDDKEHTEYYNLRLSPVCGDQRNKVGWYGVSEKKRAKLVKDLAKNLSMFSELGFGLETDGAMDKGIPEAALVLQSHLERLRSEGKKLKERKMECKQTVMEGSGSSSSSESSDSECENDQVADMSILRSEVGAEQLVAKDSVSSEPHETMAAASPISLAMPQQPCSQAEPKAIEQVGAVGLTVHNMERNCTNKDTSVQLKGVEVCMGGKCKKMGAQVLVDEFQRVLGVGGSVVECKCMGKCKTAPNVRVFNGAAVGEGDGEDHDNTVKSPISNPLYLGVGLEDVGLIADYYFRSEVEKQDSLGVSLPSMSTSTTSLCLKQ